ncbi:MAG TPA: orotidine-5'-phosphate decarboxylase [bacterium]|nr:orotidine-5'-phosphate decarboxylase [bacterium]
MSSVVPDTGHRTSDPERARGRARLIVALDVPTLNEAAALVDELGPLVNWFKIGSELYTAAGPDAVRMVLHRGGQVFLDLKYHDIPNTVGRAVAAAAALGVSMLDVHVAGGPEMLRAAVEAGSPKSGARPLILGLTLLTSDSDPQARSVVLERARKAKAARLDGVVSSAHETAAVKAACGRDFIVVTPGIRLKAAAGDDQRRTMGPFEALAAGSDYLVVGRPITQSPEPRAAAALILEDMDAALDR